MAGSESLQQRIENLDDLKQIVRTMKALSAVSIRQYERAAAALAAYEHTVELGFRAVLRQAPDALDAGGADDGPAAVIVFGSDHGLVGRFNEAVAEHVAQQLGEAARVEYWLAVGERVAPALEDSAGGVPDLLPTPSAAAGITALVQRLLLRVDAWRNAGVGHVWLFHNRPTGRAGYAPRRERLFPPDPARFAERARAPWPSRRLPQRSLPRDVLLGALLRQHYFVLLFRAAAESLAAEHGSRLAAMQAAEKNLDERLDELSSRYRRERQAAITSELLDVVAGFEAAS